MTASAVTTNRHMTLGMAADLEREIRAGADNVISMVHTRRDHPSYGYNKTVIRSRLERMNGVIGAYMLLAGDAFHTEAYAQATFTDPLTQQRVDLAHNMVAGL